MKSSMVNHLFVKLKVIKFHTIKNPTSKSQSITLHIFISKKRENEVEAGENTQQDIYPALYMFPFNGPDIHPD